MKEFGFKQICYLHAHEVNIFLFFRYFFSASAHIRYNWLQIDLHAFHRITLRRSTLSELKVIVDVYAVAIGDDRSRGDSRECDIWCEI